MTIAPDFSLADQLAKSGQYESFVDGLSDEEVVELEFSWKFWGRPKQQPPEWDWRFWVALTGRGWGKTETGARWLQAKAATIPYGYGAIIGRTAADVRDVMVEGPAGILATSDPRFRPIFEPSKRRVTFPNGAQASLFSADEPKLLRGPQHHFIWCDEIAAWDHLDETWSNLRLGLRLGDSPQCFISTTPKPSKTLRQILGGSRTHITRGSTWENSHNLAPEFVEELKETYGGTRLWRQEVEGEVLDLVDGALVTQEMIDAGRLQDYSAVTLRRIVVGIDPAVSTGESSDETGIVAAAVDNQKPPHLYVLRDVSGRYSPDEWGNKAIMLLWNLDGDRLVAERNNGGDMVEHVIRTCAGGSNVPVRTVTATRGKHVRFEPLAALYEQKRVHHVGSFPELEDQVCGFTSEGYANDSSPDRGDALVWAAYELIFSKRGLSPSDLYGPESGYDA